MQLRVIGPLSVLEQLNQTDSHIKFGLVEDIAGGLVGHAPNGFEEVHWQFGRGEEFDCGLAREVTALGFVGLLEQGIVEGQLLWRRVVGILNRLLRHGERLIIMLMQLDPTNNIVTLSSVVSFATRCSNRR
mmetsp:Transcript_3622/g.7746  ORF Transcript_3622/g.7746 Transcript_3622/m.7746 type:complete len:131 (-) Transcript_3622:16-408(-)